MLRKSVLFKWFLSYCAVIALSLVLMVVFFFQSQTIVRRQAADISRIYVAKVMEESDGIIKESITSSNLMSQSALLSSSLALAYPLEAEGYRMVRGLVEEIQKHSLVLRSCEEIIVYHKNLDMMLTPGGVTGYAGIYQL